MTIRARHIVMSKGSATQVTIDRDFQSALLALASQKPGDAVRLFEAVLRVEPEHVGALNLLGVVLTRLGRFTEAEGYLRRALQHTPPSDVPRKDRLRSQAIWMPICFSTRCRSMPIRPRERRAVGRAAAADLHGEKFRGPGRREPADGGRPARAGDAKPRRL